MAILKRHGLTDAEITKIQNGQVPKGWQVHHIKPLDDGGTNAFENLAFIKNDPYHMAITNAQNSLTRGIKHGESKTVDWPMIDSDIYPPLL